MQPRMLYTLLLILFIGSALGHGRQLKKKGLQDYDSSARLRESITGSFRTLKHYYSVGFSDYEVSLAKGLLYSFAPDREAIEANWHLPLDELCDFLLGYYTLAPVKIVENMRKEFYIFQEAVGRRLGISVE
uniref:Peptidase S41 n=1 Tax=Panagrellus redivivus TaxID=6233 RepID=A0A7E4VDJ5_PANRE